MIIPSIMDPPDSPIHIKHEGKFYARLLSKESSMNNPSFRYYGVGPGSVPFVWESAPGTPKVLISDINIPAIITPPPSYEFKYKHNKFGKKRKSNKRRFFTRVGAFKAMLGWLRPSKAKKESRVRVSCGSSRWLFSLPVVDHGGDVKYDSSSQKHGLMSFSLRRVPRFVFFWHGRK